MILLSLIRRKGEAIPRQRTALYSSYFEMFLDREAEKSAVVLEHRDIILDCHSILGWRMQCEMEAGSDRTMSSDEVVDVVRSYLADRGHDVRLADQVFDGIVERVVVIVSPEVGHYEFEVMPFQEYFAARFLYDSTRNSSFEAEFTGGLRERIEEVLRRVSWHNAARFLAGFLRPGELPTFAQSLDALRDEESVHGRTLSALAHDILRDGTLARDPITEAEVLASICRTGDFWALVLEGDAAVDYIASRSRLLTVARQDLRSRIANAPIAAAFTALVEAEILWGGPELRELVAGVLGPAASLVAVREAAGSETGARIVIERRADLVEVLLEKGSVPIAPSVLRRIGEVRAALVEAAAVIEADAVVAGVDAVGVWAGPPVELYEIRHADRMAAIGALGDLGTRRGPDTLDGFRRLAATIIALDVAGWIGHVLRRVRHDGPRVPADFAEAWVSERARSVVERRSPVHAGFLLGLSGGQESSDLDPISDVWRLTTSWLLRREDPIAEELEAALDQPDGRARVAALDAAVAVAMLDVRPQPPMVPLAQRRPLVDVILPLIARPAPFSGFVEVTMAACRALGELRHPALSALRLVTENRLSQASCEGFRSPGLEPVALSGTWRAVLSSRASEIAPTIAHDQRSALPASVSGVLFGTASGSAEREGLLVVARRRRWFDAGSVEERPPFGRLF